eukprot:NODE_1137_length_2592_cov_10.491684.p1 GENE.NODE_1137_length_2592_cov_10.491684~~NODE_1137_length_2592_cov_10.491684.p1  ORF type:complete len:762 (-),score=239.88 NODE_1137_length_2592_cov_10.491684:157-2442(-)
MAKVSDAADASPDRTPAVSPHSFRSQSSLRSWRHEEELSMSRSSFLRWLRAERDGENSCMELPLTLMLVMSYCFMCILLMRNSRVFGVEEGIEFDIEENANFAFSGYFGHKTIHDVNSIADFWSWARRGFVPLLMQSKSGYGYSEGLQDVVPYSVSDLPTRIAGVFPDVEVPLLGDYLGYNRLVGGLLFSQEVGETDDCIWPSVLDDAVASEWYGKPCLADPPVFFDVGPELKHAESHPRPRSRIEWVLLSSPYTPEEQLVDMEDGCANMEVKNRTCLCTWCAAQDPPTPWFTEFTERVEITAVFYNPTLGIYLYSGVNFFIGQSGHIYKLIDVQTAWGRIFETDALWTSVVLWISSALWCASILYIIGKESVEIFTVCRVSGLWGIYHNYISPWNVVDWVSMIFALFMLVWFGLLLEATSDTDEAYNAVLAASTPSTEQLTTFYLEVEEMVGTFRVLRYMMATYPGIILLRFFKVFSAQPRLAIVTQTAFVAMADMLHYFVVWATIFLAFVLAGMLLFGQDLSDFASFDRAVTTCFRCMLGDFEWSEMSSIGRLPAACWFFLFMITVNIILLNILVAVLQAAYDKVHKYSENALTCVEQLYKMYSRYKNKRSNQYATLFQLLNAFDVQEQRARADSELLSKVVKEIDLINVASQQAGIVVPPKQAKDFLVEAMRYNKVLPPLDDFDDEGENTSPEEGDEKASINPEEEKLEALATEVGSLCAEIHSMRDDFRRIIEGPWPGLNHATNLNAVVPVECPTPH